VNRFKKPGGQRMVSILVAVTVVVGTAIFVRNNKTPTQADDNQLDQCIATMLEAARAGDVQQYLECFTGNLHDTLATRLQKASKKRSAAELRSSETDLKSYVTTDWQRVSDNEATVVLERIYPTFNKRHQVRLRRGGRTWKIVELVPVETYAPAIPYGTPVFQPPSQDSGETTAAERAPQPDDQPSEQLPGKDRAKN